MSRGALPDDPFQGEEWDALVRSVIDGPEALTRSIYTSAVGISLVPDEATGVDVKFAIELGFMVMYDKPILAVVKPGAQVPAKLRLVAERVVAVDLNSPEDQARLATVIQKFIQDHKEEEA